MHDPCDGLVPVAIGILIHGEGKKAALAHGAYVGNLLVHVAIGKCGDVLLVDLAYGIVVVEIGVAMDENVVEPGAEQAGDSELE